MNVSLFEMSAGLLLSTDPNSTAQLEELVHTYNTAGSVPEKVAHLYLNQYCHCSCAAHRLEPALRTNPLQSGKRSVSDISHTHLH